MPTSKAFFSRFNRCKNLATTHHYSPYPDVKVLLIEAARCRKTSNHSPELTAAGRILYVSKLECPLMILLFCYSQLSAFHCAQICAASLQQCLSRSLRYQHIRHVFKDLRSIQVYHRTQIRKPSPRSARASIHLYKVCSWRYRQKHVKEFSIFHRLKDDFSPS